MSELRSLLLRCVACIAAAFACTGAPATPAPAAPDSRGPAGPDRVTPAALEAHMRVLGADSLEGRGTGTPGYDKAARYVAERFEAAGLEPHGTAGYLQPVPLRHGHVLASTLTIEGPSGRRELVAGRDYVAVPNLADTASEVSAELVLAGFGVTAPDHAYDDYRGVDARGKIVVMLTGAPAAFPPAERAHYATTREKAGNAVKHGAVGILIVRTRDVTFPWPRLVRQARGGAMRWLRPDGVPHDVFPDIRAVAMLSDSGAAAVFADAPQTLDQVLSGAATGEAPAFPIPVTATLRVSTGHTRRDSPNVIAMLPGADPQLRDEVLVYSAHLDHLGVGEPVRGDSIYNGVLDNASGVAALIEVARMFAALPERPRRSVLFVAVTGEEMGLLGSDYFAQHPTVPKASMIANVNIDGLAILYPMRDVVAFGAEHSTLDSAVETAARSLGVSVSPDPFPQEAFFVRSDQYSFVRQGIPAVFPFMGLQGDSGVDAAARFREWFASRYHTPQDDLSQPMDLGAGVRHTILAFRVGLETANADERPAWKPGSVFSRLFGGRR